MSQDPVVIDLVRDVLASAARPSRPMTHREMAESMTLPDGPMQGQAYQPVLDAVHDCVIGELDRGWHSLRLVGCVQTGKSLAGMLVPIVRQLVSLRRSVVYSQPTKDKLHEAWAGKLQPSIDGSGYGAWLPTDGQGSKGGQTPKFVVTRDPQTRRRSGMLYLIPGGGSNESAQAGVSAPLVCVDEVDSFPDRHRVELVGKRADAFRSGACRIYTSTVKSDIPEGEGASVILAMYEESTRSRLWFACPECGRYQTLEWERVTYDDTDDETAAETARLACAHCPAKWDDAGRRMALRNWKLVHDGQVVDHAGHIIGPRPRTHHFGLLWTGLDSTLRDLPGLAVLHRSAAVAKSKGDHGPMRSFVRDQLCQRYRGDVDEETSGPMRWQDLIVRAQGEKWGPMVTMTDRESAGPHYLYSRRVSPVPADAEWAVGAVDMQHDRAYWVLKALNREGTVYDMAWGYDYARIDHGAADQHELGGLLQRLQVAMSEYADTLPIPMIGLDIGDGTRTDVLSGFVQSTGRPWVAVKGHTHSLKVEPGDLEGMVYFRNGSFLIQVDNVRSALQASLRRPRDAKGATRLPGGLGMHDSSYVRHLTAEQHIIDPKTLKPVILRQASRHDWLDAAVYGHALILGFLRDMRDNEARKPEHERLRLGQNPPAAPQEPRQFVSIRVGDDRRATHAPIHERRRSSIGGRRR